MNRCHVGLVFTMLWGLPAWASAEQKPLEVNGQSRNLNMMLVLRDDKDKIKFVKVRENYRDEIIDDAGEGTNTSTAPNSQPTKNEEE